MDRPRRHSGAGALSPRAARVRAALTDTVAEQGYAAATVEDIVTRAGVTRSFFDLEYANKERCLIATFECFAQQVYGRLVSSYRRVPDHAANRAGSLHASIHTLMHMVATRQAPSWLCLVEARGAGRAATRHCKSAETYLAHLLQTGLPPSDERLISSDAAAAIVGGIWHVTSAHLIADTASQLPKLTDEIVRWALSYTDEDVWTSDRRRPAHHENAASDLAEPSPEIAQPEDAKEDLILASVATAVSDRGYQHTTVRDIARHLGLSTSSFYRHFPSKDNAVLTASQHFSRHIIETATAAFEAACSPVVGIRDAITSLSRSLHDDPQTAHLLMLDSLELGPPAREIHDQAIKSLANLYTAAFDIGPTDEVTLNATTGAVWSTLRAQAGHIDADPERILAGELTFVALAPFIGRDAALVLAGQ